MKAGIQTRLLITTTLVLGTSLTLAGVVLDRSFQASIVAGAEEQLRLVIYSLMGAMDDYGDGMRFDLDFSEPRLNQPESGLYAVVEQVRTQLESQASQERIPSGAPVRAAIPSKRWDVGARARPRHDAVPRGSGRQRLRRNL